MREPLARDWWDIQLEQAPVIPFHAVARGLGLRYRSLLALLDREHIAVQRTSAMYEWSIARQDADHLLHLTQSRKVQDPA